MENPIKMDDLGGKPTIFGNIHIYFSDWFETTKYPPVNKHSWLENPHLE